MQGYSITSPPLAVRDKIIVGIGGGEYGIRGFLDAYDPATGRRLWRFNSVPGEGEFGHDTWLGESWKRGSGATWLTGSYDPELDLVYWAVGNPGPGFDATIRTGDNLFTCSVVALDPATGARKWHYQFTPGDTHDWDSTEDMVLIDRAGKKLLLHADRNGFFYTLDRASGKFIAASPFVRQTWAKGFDAQGRPIVNPGWDATPEGSAPISPDIAGGTNFQAPSYSPITGLMYLAYRETEVHYVRTPVPFEAGKQYWGGKSTLARRPIPPASARLIQSLAKSYGITRCTAARSPTASSPRPAECCSPRRRKATSSRSTPAPASFCGASKPASRHGRVADELCDRGPAVRRDIGGKCPV